MVFEFIGYVVPVLVAVAMLTLYERKLLAGMQLRRGPNIVGFGGLLQPIMDGVKLVLKESVFPVGVDLVVFVASPVVIFVLSLVLWAFLPFLRGYFFVDLDLGLLYLFVISSLGVYALIMSGWSSNSKYSFLGGVRSAAQFISYEILFGVVVLSIGMVVGSFSLNEVVLFQRESGFFFYLLFPLFAIFFIACLAETNRTPFDLPEAESELVSGYNVEYSAIIFAFFFLAEYANIIFMSCLCVVLFFGGWLPMADGLEFIPDICWFCGKMVVFISLFVVVRGILPRYRFDQLIVIGWKTFLPMLLGYFVFLSFLVVL